MTYYTAWQGVGVPTGPTASAPPTAAVASDIMATIQAPGNRTTQFLVNAYGELTTTFDPSGQQTIVTYSNNNSGRDPVSVLHPDLSRDTLAYDGLDRVVMSQPAGDSATYYHYNAASQVDSTWGQNTVATYYQYNAADNTLSSTGDASGVTMTYTYNSWKEVVSATDNMGHQTTYGYDGLFLNQDTVTAPGGRTTTSVLDVEGRPSVTSAPLMASDTVKYDVMNRVTQTVQAGRPATVLGYDALFQTDMTDARGNATHTDYNALGWPVARRDANGVSETFRYDLAGRITSWTNRCGDVMTYTYDARDRILSRSGRGISDNYSYSPDSPYGNIMVAWNSVERDSIFQQPVVGSQLGADSTVTWVNGVRYRVLHGHVGSLATSENMSISSSSGVSFRDRSTGLDGTTGLVNSINDGFNTATPGYNSEALPTSLYNPVSGTRSTDYMSLHAPSDMSFSNATLENTFGRLNHYDVLGRLDRLSNLSAANQHAYYFDLYGELTQDVIYAGCSGSNSSVSADEGANFATCSMYGGETDYSYDAVGNRTDLGATYYYGNRLGNFNGGFLTYDADGNVTQKYGIQPNPHNQLFYWNPESRLDSLTYDGYYSVRYEYNALGKPVRKYRQGALDRVWLWDGEDLLAEFDGSNQRVADYQYSGTDQPYAYTYGASSAAGVRYHEQDALGNVIGTHEGANVTQTITYDAWGSPSVSGNLDSRLMWKGLMWEGGPAQGDVVGLYYMRGRWYDPQLGRFIQEDPIHSGVNDYTFANNDPVNGSDPSGRCPQNEIIAVRGEDGNFVPVCPDGSEPTFTATAPLPPSVTMSGQSLPTVTVTGDSPVSYSGFDSALGVGAGYTFGLGNYENGGAPGGYVKVGMLFGVGGAAGVTRGKSDNIKTFAGPGLSPSICAGYSFGGGCFSFNGSKITGWSGSIAAGLKAGAYVELAHTFTFSVDQTSTFSSFTTPALEARNFFHGFYHIP